MKLTDYVLGDWLNDIVDPLKPFTFSRWGDGEWRSLLNLRTASQNCDGHRFYPQMGLELRDVLSSKPTYRLGMQGLAVKLFGLRINKFLTQHLAHDLAWYDADVFHRAAINKRLHEVITAVSTRKVLLVGPAHLKKVPLEVWKFVEVPCRNAYLSLDSVFDAVVQSIEGQTEPLLASVSMGMSAEILLHRLHKSYGSVHTMIDFGSLWDPLVGIKSRAYMRVPSR
jgi:hypothetical protein